MYGIIYLEQKISNLLIQEIQEIHTQRNEEMIQLIHAFLTCSSHLHELLVVLIVIYLLLELLHICCFDAVFAFMKVLWIREGIIIRFNQCGLENRAGIFLAK